MIISASISFNSLPSSIILYVPAFSVPDETWIGVDKDTRLLPLLIPVSQDRLFVKRVVLEEEKEVTRLYQFRISKIFEKVVAGPIPKRVLLGEGGIGPAGEEKTPSLPAYSDKLHLLYDPIPIQEAHSSYPILTEIPELVTKTLEVASVEDTTLDLENLPILAGKPTRSLSVVVQPKEILLEGVEK